MPPPSVNTRPMPRNSNQASSTSMAEMDKLRAENDRLTKEKTSKAGEISGMVIDSILLFCLLFHMKVSLSQAKQQLFVSLLISISVVLRAFHKINEG